MENTTKNRELVETKRLWDAINKKGLKVRWIAEQLSVNPSLLSMYINGARKFPRELAAPLATLLEKDESFVLECFYLK